METTELEFEHFLAEKLHMTVARLRREVSSQEFMQWSVYYGRKAQRQEMATKTASRRA
jgi:hypothetical protein